MAQNEFRVLNIFPDVFDKRFTLHILISILNTAYQDDSQDPINLIVKIFRFYEFRT